MRRLLAADDFARLASDKGAVADAGVYRFSTATADLTSVVGRSIPYVFSDASVARDTHTINQAGWQLTNFLRNPVFLWAHDDSGLPLGKVTDVTTGAQLRGVVEYAERDLYPFADTVFQMVKQGFLSAVSTAWLPIDWKFSTDKARRGGIDFITQELLEVSQVPVPALATALAEARSAGIDTGPAFDWAEHILDSGGMVMVPRAQLEQLRREAKMPKTTKAKRDEAKAEEQRLATEKKNSTIRRFFKRGLYEVSSLAYLLMQLAWIEDATEFEAEIEQDGSDIPGRLTQLLNDAGQILVDMTVEEVAELLAVEAAEETPGVMEAAFTAAAKTDGQKTLMALLRHAKANPKPLTSEELRAIAREAIGEAMKTELPNLISGSRSGKVLSATNVTALTEAMDHHKEMGRCIRGVLDSAIPDDEVDDNPDDGSGDDGSEDRTLADAQAAELDLICTAAI